MTGVEIGLLVSLVGVLGLTGGKIWERKAIEDKFLPKKEHDLGCANVQLQIAADITSMKEEIIEAIKENGNCSQCRTDSTRSSE